MKQKENIYLSQIRRKDCDTLSPEEYPLSIPVIKEFQSLQFRKSVTFIVGPNGSGKSTLLEAIAVLLNLNPEGGSKNFNFHTVETHSQLSDALIASRADLSYKDAFFFRAESYYNVASEIDRIAESDYDMYNSYGGKSIHQYSHGEGFMALIRHRLNNKGLYLFDEPEAALSFSNQLAFLCWMKEAVTAGAQLIIATHSPVVLSYPHATIYEIEDNVLKETTFEECSIYKDIYDYLFNRELYLKEMGLL
ncbi:MAG: AAA family ATPase [Paludibacteraceae bacterium]|nr:AAA family ATPase [Paludibacteraceae bacterium]